MTKSKFDPDAAFKNIIGSQKEQNTGKGRPKVDRETKKRISLAVFPSIYEDIQRIAYVERRSTSDIVGELFEAYVKKNKDKLKEYDEITNK